VLAGHDVHVVATTSALRFVGRPTLEAISRNPVHTELFDGVAEVRHVALGQRADLIVIAPATAHILAALAMGLSDDLLGTTVLASSAPLLIAPAMHTEMWEHAATRANVATLVSRGATIVGPGTGQLTGSDSGAGRMAEPEEILARASGLLLPQDLVGRRVLISAGGTREPLDPVRFLGNRSSGKQGVALALAARARGADVTLIASHLEVAPPAGIAVVQVSTALELETALRDHATTHDTILMAAAVADFRPRTISPDKIKKDRSDGGLQLDLERTPDILRGLTERRSPGTRIVGFAAETADTEDALLALGADKARRKGVDVLVVNRVGWSEGFGADDNSVIILDGEGVELARAHGDKVSVAHRILDVVA